MTGKHILKKLDQLLVERSGMCCVDELLVEWSGMCCVNYS